MEKFDDAEFKDFESKIDRVLKILENMNSSDEIIQNLAMSQANSLIQEDPDLDNFLVKVRDDRTIINKIDDDEAGAVGTTDKCVKEMDKFTFMQQMETDAAQRAEIRKEREDIAQDLRTLGNAAFQNCDYEKAINMYTKAIDHVKDSPVLYNNRALSKIKLKLYKRAIADCDYVINKLDEKNLKAWLYRAAAYYYMNDEDNFNLSVKMAKKSTSKETEYIDQFIEVMRTKINNLTL